jgi:hypothetical protein
MSRTLIVLDCAKEDVQKAISWYERQLPGLGDSLLLSVEATLDANACYPESYQIDFGMVRRAPTHRFPFAVYYRVLSQIVEVAAILDCRLDPSVVQSRFDIEPRH